MKTLSQRSSHLSGHHSGLRAVSPLTLLVPSAEFGFSRSGAGPQLLRTVNEEVMSSSCPGEVTIYNLEGFPFPLEEKLFINPATWSIRHLRAIKTQ